MKGTHDPSRAPLSVGGPGGIQIGGGIVRAGGAPILQSPRAPMPLAAGSLEQLSPLLAVVADHPWAVAMAAVAAGGALVASAAAAISVLQLPWLLMTAPAGASLVLVALVLSIVARQRAQLRTAGVDPAMEHRIIELAMQCGGKLTVPAVAHALGVPMVHADAILTALARSGHVGIDNDPETGVVVYVMPAVQAGLVHLRRSP
jgi:hypothetical protein